MTIQEFIAKHDLFMTSRKVGSNPYMADSSWSANHYRVTIYADIPGARKLHSVFYFSMGLAHTSPPELPDVLDCLRSDSGALFTDFESWASELGYSTDSKSAKKTYNACLDNALHLRSLLGESVFSELLESVESL